jgi:hypothetical protein
MVGPTVDPATRNALVYVDLAAPLNGSKAGMFARGEFRLGESTVWTLPQSAVQLRDGQASVLVVGTDNRVSPLKVAIGRRSAERVELVQALPENTRVVTSGGAFLAEGDLVKVVQSAPSSTPPAVPPNTTPTR